MGRSTQRAPSHTRPPAGSPARVPSTPCPARPMSLAWALPRGPGQLSTVPGSPPALTPGTRPAPGRQAGGLRAPHAPCRDPRDGAGGKGLESPWGARPLGSEAAGRLVEGTSGQGVNGEPWASRGPLTRPTEPPPQGRAPLPAPGGVQSPEGGLASLETLCFLSSRVCLCLSLCPTSVSLSLHPTLSSHCALGESRGSRRAPPPQLGPPGAGWGAQGTRGAGGCSRVIPG